MKPEWNPTDWEEGEQGEGEKIEEKSDVNMITTLYSDV